MFSVLSNKIYQAKHYYGFYSMKVRLAAVVCLSLHILYQLKKYNLLPLGISRINPDRGVRKKYKVIHTVYYPQHACV